MVLCGSIVDLWKSTNSGSIKKLIRNWVEIGGDRRWSLEAGVTCGEVDFGISWWWVNSWIQQPALTKIQNFIEKTLKTAQLCKKIGEDVRIWYTKHCFEKLWWFYSNLRKNNLLKIEKAGCGLHTLEPELPDVRIFMYKYGFWLTEKYEGTDIIKNTDIRIFETSQDFFKVFFFLNSILFSHLKV